MDYDDDCTTIAMYHWTVDLKIILKFYAVFQYNFEKSYTILNKILTSIIQQNIERIINHDPVGFIPGVHSYVDIQKSITVQIIISME